jgi:flagellar hook-associated protein 2
MASTFNVGGLASGLDTNSIVDKLVAIESLPITTNSKRQSALSVQISTIGDLVSKIKTLSTTASNLSKGVAAASVASSPSGVTATTGTGALPGTYTISVGSVASAAKARSTGFTSPNDTVAGGTLDLTVKGTAYHIDITANSDLGAVVSQINQSGAPISAAVISDGTNYYVSLTNRETGKPIGSGLTGGLTIDNDPTGLAFAVTQNATNATLTIDQTLNVESQTNEITNAIPGVTLNVKAQQLVDGDLVINRDTSTSQAKLQSFVDAFNSVLKVLNTSLRPDPKAGPNDGSRMDGSLTLDLQRSMYRMLSTTVSATGTVRTLADIGVKLQNDGTLTLDATTFSSALSKDATAVDAIFATASTGVAAQAATLSTRYTDIVDGQLIQRQDSLKKTIDALGVSNQRLQQHVDAYRDQLLARFAHMESLISSYNSISTYLNNAPTFKIYNSNNG